MVVSQSVSPFFYGVLYREPQLILIDSSIPLLPGKLML